MIQSLVYLLIYLLILGVVLWLVLYVVQQLPLPPPFAQVARVVVTVIGCLVLILLLLDFAGMVGIGRPLLR